jgi:hypothetical protein
LGCKLHIWLLRNILLSQRQEYPRAESQLSPGRWEWSLGEKTLSLYYKLSPQAWQCDKDQSSVLGIACTKISSWRVRKKDELVRQLQSMMEEVQCYESPEQGHRIQVKWWWGEGRKAVLEKMIWKLSHGGVVRFSWLGFKKGIQSRGYRLYWGQERMLQRKLVVQNG